MDKKSKITSPRYQQIAADIASKIATGHYKLGEKIYARSMLASQYGVSSETSRRAICILSDLDIVDTTKGSGVVIKSCENAIKFIKQYNDVQTVNDLKLQLLNSIERQTKENLYFKERLVELIDKTDRLKYTNPFVPFEISINNTCLYIGRSLSEIHFWQNTTATVVAIKREEGLIMSPGPHAILLDDDVLYFVGYELCYDRVLNFLYP
ncbi:MAG: TrkA C-terminal domain-containing protein [Clostridium sp.]|uniref:TrkA C-terminal domain-containing protein n=1 Tax=Clostridium sp. TaxID=1506 RepID=UPI003023A9B0